MATTTPEAIRDRVYTLIEGLTPTSDNSVRFRRHRNEDDGEFIEHSENNADAALRRFQVRDTGTDDPPEVSNLDVELRRLVYTITIAYPQNARYGIEQAMDRDDVMDQDWWAINAAIGWGGAANFTSATADATPLGCTKAREIGEACDYLVITAEFQFYREV